MLRQRLSRFLAGSVLALLLLPAAAGPASAADAFPGADPRPDGRFGGIQVSDVPIATATDLGLGWTRELYLWNAMGNRFDPGMFNRISTDQNMPANSLREVGLLQFFASYCNGNQEKYVPCSNDAVAQYAGGLAKAKQGKVNDWILYNEEDICNHDHPGFSWNSANHAADYYQFQKTAYKAIKANNPGATVIFGSLSITDPSCQNHEDELTFFKQWLAVAQADPEAPANNWFFDNLSLNIHKEPEKIYDLLRRYHETMQAAGFDKSTWIMEMGIPVTNAPIDPAQNGGLTVNKGDEQSFLVQAYANAIAAAADHIGIYKMSDFPATDPAYKTIKTAIKYMSRVTSATKSVRAVKGSVGTPDNRATPGFKYVDRCDCVVTITMNGPGFQTVVAYNRDMAPQQVTIPATAPTAWIADKNGNEQQVTAQNGAYTFTLDPVNGTYLAPWGETVRFIGGSPIMLRQAA
jgi:hypothetical protein